MKYKEIAAKILSDIQSEKLAQGQRLVSLRQLSKQHGISMTTAINCYHYLETKGWLVSHPQSGFYVATPYQKGNIPLMPQFKSGLTSLNKSAVANFAALNQIRSGPFGISQLAPSQLPIGDIKGSIKRTLKEDSDLLCSYPDPQGLSDLRKALSGHFSRKGFVVAPQELMVSNGCMDAIRMALSVTTKPGDAVAISSPCFNGLLTLLASMSLKVIEIPCNADGVDLQQFESQLKNKKIAEALFSSSHMNPHGICLSVKQKKRLASLANEYQIPIIEDDVYGELGYDGTFALPISYWDENGYVLWCSSVSKSIMSGLRIGWCAAGCYLNSAINLCATESLGHNALMQMSLAKFNNSGQYQSHLHQVRTALHLNARAYRRVLLGHLPQGSAVSLPQGGLVLWVQVPGMDDVKSEQALMNLGFDCRFGHQFTTRNLYRDCLRINIGWSLGEAFDDCRNIEQALTELAQTLICH